MITLFPSLRVTDMDASLAFYRALGYVSIGSVDVDGAKLFMLKLPDEPSVSLELVARSGQRRVDMDCLDHLAIQVDDLAAAIQRLTEAGLDPTPLEYPGGPDGAMTSGLIDPDGYRLELVEWPPGHPVGMTEADFA